MIGIDIIEIERIEQAMENERFLVKNFSPREIEYFKIKNFSPQTVAGNFCAKEAFAKALGTGVSGFCLLDVEVLRFDSGQPYVLFESKKYSASISHCKSYATAVVMLD